MGTNKLKRLKQWIDYQIIFRDAPKTSLTVSEESKTLQAVDPNAPIVIKSAEQYRRELAEGKKNFDFSQWDLRDDDIRNLNLENLGLNINLREIFVPYGGRMLAGRCTLTPLYSFGHDFIDLRRSNLKGNKVEGGLEDFKNKYSYQVCTFLYNEDTFDEVYMKDHPEFFLDKDAPKELKDKYYNPRVDRKVNDDGKEIEAWYFQKLTFSEYLKYYPFLHGKYLDRFIYDAEDKVLIDMAEYLGLQKTSDIIDTLGKSKLPLSVFLDGVDDIETYEEMQEVFDNGDDNGEAEIIVSMLDSTIQREKLLKRNFPKPSIDSGVV